MSNLILGAAGQLGTALRRLLPDAAAVPRHDADLTRPDSLRAVLQATKPAVVVNCAAYNAVDQAERDIAGAFAVNAFGVRDLALACREIDATLVHISTNYVFGQDESRSDPYRETDAPGPISAYGASKLAGESFARSIGPRNLVIRTCGLFGTIDSAKAPWNFVEKLLDRARRGERLRVIDDQVGTPTAAADLAEATLHLLRCGASGLYHFTNAGACSWHEFAVTAVRLAGMDLPIEPVTSDTFNAPARRPAYSVLDCSAYESVTCAKRPTWQDALAKYFT